MIWMLKKILPADRRLRRNSNAAYHLLTLIMYSLVVIIGNQGSDCWLHRETNTKAGQIPVSPRNSRGSEVQADRANLRQSGDKSAKFGTEGEK